MTGRFRAPHRIIRDGRLIAAEGHFISDALAEEVGLTTPSESPPEPARDVDPPSAYGGKGGAAKSSPDAFDLVRGGEIDPSPYHIGGPWYEIEGTKVRGKQAAIEALATLNETTTHEEQIDNG